MLRGGGRFAKSRPKEGRLRVSKTLKNVQTSYANGAPSVPPILTWFGIRYGYHDDFFLLTLALVNGPYYLYLFLQGTRFRQELMRLTW